ncbi:thrombopoietin receptor [Vombatus ursinus]|uniref:thrombopoietin receptor n=1 Tax=Vombatus ursinus TaxID=29139 RepID=UPI000FFCFE6C|nr:thrombopoietin receptor [Vombatus ursinus]
MRARTRVIAVEGMDGDLATDWVCGRGSEGVKSQSTTSTSSSSTANTTTIIPGSSEGSYLGEKGPQTSSSQTPSLGPQCGQGSVPLRPLGCPELGLGLGKGKGQDVGPYLTGTCGPGVERELGPSFLRGGPGSHSPHAQRMPAWVFILVICCLFLLPSRATTHVSNEGKRAEQRPCVPPRKALPQSPGIIRLAPSLNQPETETAAQSPERLLDQKPMTFQAPRDRWEPSCPQRAPCAACSAPCTTILPLLPLVMTQVSPGQPKSWTTSSGSSCEPCASGQARQPLMPGLAFRFSPDASLLAAEPEPLRCFSRQYEDLTCFWDEVEEEEKEKDCAKEEEEGGEEDPGPYKLFFAYPGEEPQVCPLRSQRLPEGGLRHVCQVQPADGVRLFAKLTLWVWDPAKDRNRTQRVLNLENVGLPAPPKSITAVTSGQTGELQVTWEVQPSEISDFMQHELQYGPLDPSNSAQPTVRALLQAPMCCPFMRWPHTQPHQATATPKPDLTPAQLPGTQSIQQYPTIEGPSRKGYMSQGPAIRGHTVPQWDGPGQLGATREVPRFLWPHLLSPVSDSVFPPLQYQELIGGSCIISGFQPGISYWLQLRSKPDEISLKGFWGPWSSPVTVTLPRDASEIGLQCFTQDLEHITCQWQGPTHPTTSHGYFYHWRAGSCPKNRGPAWEKCEKMDSRAEETPISHCHFESRNDSAIHILVEITTEQGTIHQYLATPFWMHQIVLTEAPELQWTVGSNGQLKLTWRPPLPWLPGQTHYQLRYSGQKLDHWKVLEPPRGALGETLELRPGAQYRLQLRARPDGPTYHGPWSAWSAPALVELAPESGWVSVVTSAVLTLGFGGLVGLVLRRLFPARFRALRQTLWPPLPDLHRVLGGFLTEPPASMSQPKASASGGDKEEEPSLLEVLSESVDGQSQLDYPVLLQAGCLGSWSTPLAPAPSESEPDPITHIDNYSYLPHLSQPLPSSNHCHQPLDTVPFPRAPRHECLPVTPFTPLLSQVSSSSAY